MSMRASKTALQVGSSGGRAPKSITSECGGGTDPKPSPPDLVERGKGIFSSMLDLIVVDGDLAMSRGLERRWATSTSKRM